MEGAIEHVKGLLRRRLSIMYMNPSSPSLIYQLRHPRLRRLELLNIRPSSQLLRSTTSTWQSKARSIDFRGALVASSTMILGSCWEKRTRGLRRARCHCPAVWRFARQYRHLSTKRTPMLASQAESKFALDIDPCRVLTSDLA